MKKEELILPKDQELLKQFDGIEPRPVMRDEELNYKMTRIQIEASMRSRKTMVDLDKSNKKFSLAFIALAFIQITLAMFDSIFQITTYPDQSRGYVYLAIFFIMMIFITRIIYKDLNKQ